MIYKLFQSSPKNQVSYHAGKSIENVVFYFYKITLKHVSVYYEITSTINYWFLTNQNACTVLDILQLKILSGNVSSKIIQ